MSNSNEKSVIDKIIEIKDSLPRKQRELCDYILKKHESIGLITMKELAENAGVGISTIVRAINALGYENFNDLQKDLYEASLPSKWTLKKSFQEIQEVEGKQPTLVKVWQESIDLLNKTLNPSLLENFDKVIELMMDASCINLLGTRPYKATALYFEQLLGEFYPKVRQLSHDTEVIFDRILQLSKDEILIIFAFEPYTNRVVHAAKLVHELGNDIILITDYISCPIYPYATVTLEIEVSQKQFSIIPIIALIDALVVEIGKRTSSESINKLKRLEQTLWKASMCMPQNKGGN